MSSRTHRPARADRRTPSRRGASPGVRLPLAAAAVVAAGLTAACGPSAQSAGSAAAPSAASAPPAGPLSAAAPATGSPSASPSTSVSLSTAVSASASPTAAAPSRTGSTPARSASAAPTRTSASAGPAAIPGPGYDGSADAQKQIDAALRAARSEGRMVLLDFGANWCGNCKAADQVFAQPQTAALLGASYRMVKVDIGGNSPANSALLRRYSPSGGTYTMPVLVVVSPSGTVRTDTHVTGNPSLTSEGVNAFLRRWAS